MFSNKKTTIPFEGYLSATLPRYKSFSELKRNEAYYLSNIHDKVDNYINDPGYSYIPYDVLSEILMVDLQKYDTFIDINGNVLDLSGGEYYTLCDFDYEPYFDHDNDSPFAKKVMAVNNVLLNNKIDFEATILYNLIEIRPINSSISPEYLKYYFYYRGKDTDGWNYLDWAYEAFCRTLEEQTGDSRYIYTPDILKSGVLVIDDLSLHSEIISSFQDSLYEQRNPGRLALQEAFKSPLYEQLKSLEKAVKIKILNSDMDPESKSNNLSTLTGLLTLLDEGMRVYVQCKQGRQEHIHVTSLLNFFLSCEMIIRAKLFLHCNRIIDSSKGFSYLLSEYRNSIEWIPNYSEFTKGLYDIKETRNKAAHTGERITIHEAEMIVNKVCNTICKIMNIRVK